MIVLDPSVAVEMILREPAGLTAYARLKKSDYIPHAPFLVDVEVCSVLRRLTLQRDLTASEAAQALEDFQAIPLVRHPHQPLLRRAFELRNGLTAYDAVYVALAEELQIPLWTRDEHLSRSPGHTAKIEVL